MAYVVSDTVIQTVRQGKRLHERSPHGFYAGREFLDLTEADKAAGRSCRFLKEAEKLYRHSIEIEARGPSPFNSAIAHYQLGLLLHWQGRCDEAREEYNRAAALLNNLPNPEAPSALSDCHFRLGDLAEARCEYDAAVSHFERSRVMDQMRGDTNAVLMSEKRLSRLRETGRPEHHKGSTENQPNVEGVRSEEVAPTADREYMRLRIEAADRAWADAERKQREAENADAVYESAKDDPTRDSSAVHELWAQVHLTQAAAESALVRASIESEGAELAEYRRIREEARSTKELNGRARVNERDRAAQVAPAQQRTLPRIRRGRLWHFFHPRGYTRKLTSAELELARGPASRRDSAFLAVECHKCEVELKVPWRSLPNTASMSPPERHRFIMTDQRTYPCPSCRAPYFVTWSGKEVTIMRKRPS